MESIISDKRGETFKTSAEEALLVQKHTEEKPRISAALTKNIASPKSLDMFASLNVSEKELLEMTEADKLYYVDRRGKAIALNPEQGKIITLISSYIPWQDPATKEKIGRITHKIEYAQDLKGDEDLLLDVNIFQLSQDKNGNKKKASVIQCANQLKNITNIKQAQTYIVNGVKITSIFPLIEFAREDYAHYSEVRDTRGRREKDSSGEEEEKKVLIKAKLRLSPLFLYQANRRFCPLYVRRLMDVWKRNQTDIFWNILNDLQAKWSDYRTAAIKAVKETSKGNADLEKKNPGEFYKRIREAKKAALVYKASAATIRSRIPTDYETTRAQRQRFLPDLQKAISSLVEYGIITDETRVKNDKGTITVYFHYNPDFIPEEEKALQ